MSVANETRKLTTLSIRAMKQEKKKIAALTAYDFITASLLDAAGVDVILVGDSLSNVIQGNETTLPVSVDEMIYHTKAVQKGVRRALLVTDMPFMSYQVTVEDAVRNCGRVMKETRADAVKLEGGAAIIPIVERLTEIGIPVMGHLGLTPQSINVFGTYKVRGTEKKERDKIIGDARLLADAGVFAIVLEKIPAELAREITGSVSVPTIGIGAGPGCDGQILVVHDMLGLTEQFRPRFVRRYANLAELIRENVSRYVDDVRRAAFPDKNESY
jgi:3-methyl-2-oxobutanoate hydroxymethyltransferase